MQVPTEKRTKAGRNLHLLSFVEMERLDNAYSICAVKTMEWSHNNPENERYIRCHVEKRFAIRKSSQE